MTISVIEQETLDIEWFFCSNQKVGFVASGGGKLPLSVSASWEKTNILSDYFRELPKVCGVSINPDLCTKNNPAVVNQQLSHFIFMAGRGLYTYDRTILNDFSCTMYHWVAQPAEPLFLNSLPHQIRQILVETQIENMGAILDLAPLV